MNNKTTNPRRAALDSLIATERDGRYSNLEINSAIGRSDMTAADRGLYTRLVYGVIEKKLTLDHVIAKYSRIAPEDLDPDAFSRMLAEVRTVYDWCLIDAPAGIGTGFRLAVRNADLAMVVTGGDPAALRDGARTAEALEQVSKAEARIVVNRIRKKFFQRTRSTVDDCMDLIGLPLLGIVPEDETVTLAAARGVPLCRSSQKGAALACRHIARRLCGVKQPLLNL